MGQTTITVRLDGAGPAEAGALAAELKLFLQSEDPALEVNVQREDPSRQDLGTVLMILVPAAGTIGLKQAVRAWKYKHRDRRLVLDSEHGHAVVDSPDEAEAAVTAVVPPA
ncbi:hypothetical protein OM076_18295 [Solirubrobacter ginsenosidimutans]|uniref:Uncharacterized protein n=1 Tax=Solirubrobacter ginsenosidimutans TaxID=490573 RepID=A0A9X3MT92_9ACTN|nr:hypothetical protein [Solirubrobacter ginsenosidimutans]MDA0162229.1 hypothetical protein [Solirubrobacter ginsenosidimutans]